MHEQCHSGCNCWRIWYLHERFFKWLAGIRMRSLTLLWILSVFFTLSAAGKYEPVVLYLTGLRELTYHSFSFSVVQDVFITAHIRFQSCLSVCPHGTGSNWPVHWRPPPIGPIGERAVDLRLKSLIVLLHLYRLNQRENKITRLGYSCHACIN